MPDQPHRRPPGVGESEFFEPLGVVSLAVEAVFFVLALAAIRGRT